jgi:predicted porin
MEQLMKKSLLALAVLGAFAGAASAQSSVTIYGIVDASVARVDNGGDSATRLDSGNNNASRIGFKGVEDLGNGLKGTFVLENGFNVDDGSQGNNNNGGTSTNPAAGSATFSRLAYVGLEGGFGAVRLGRQNSQLKTALAQIDPFETSGIVSAISYFGGNQAGTMPERISNQITYTSPNFSGFTGQLGYVFGESAGDTSANSSWGLQLGYANGPLNVQFGYNDQDQSNAANDTLNKTKTALLGATYDFGVVKLHAAYGQKKRNGDLAPTATDLKVKSALIGVTVPFGASKIRAEYIRNNDDRDNFDNNVAALSYTYSLSKRTTLYATYARISNDSNAAGTVGSNLGFGTSPAVVIGENPSAFAVGVQHNF